MTRREIKAKFDEIVDFAEVERFLDTPVKRYSSGMYVRLAFAVAAHLEPEILVVDEVLAVGDAAFQKKCLGKMGTVAEKEGRTVLFVSHNTLAVSQLCSKSVYLKNGNIEFIGKTQNALELYLGQFEINELNSQEWSVYTENGITLQFKINVSSKGIASASIKPGDDLEFIAKIVTESPIKKAILGIGIDDVRGTRVVTLHTRYQQVKDFYIDVEGIFKAYWQDIFLAPGFYQLVIALYDNEKRVYYWDNVKQIHVIPSNYFGTKKLPDASQGRVLARANWDFSTTESYTEVSR
jgi:lipopolysaccharide transport system ATP-binding protein